MAATPESIPAHVPPERVIDFDIHLDPRLKTDPKAVYISLLKELPIAYTPRNGGHWIISGYENVFEALRNPATFSSIDQHIPRSERPQFQQIPVMMDPPEHALYRGLIAPVLAPKAVGALEQNTRALARELIANFAARGECDFVRDFAAPVPVTIFLRLMDLPTDRLLEFRQWTDQFFSASSEEALRSANDQIVAYISAVIRERIRSPGTDVISRLLASRVHDRAVTVEEVESICFLLFVAGTDTVTNTLAFAFRHLANAPDLQARLAAEPELLPEAVEEFLRRFSTSNVQRRVAKDTVFKGVPLKRDDRVILATSTVGSDPALVADPLKFDVARELKQHLAFGAGPHRCAGSHLARIELRVCLEEWLKVIPQFGPRLGIEPATRGGVVMAIYSLPLVWQPRATAAD